jgi:hypothetical protein
MARPLARLAFRRLRSHLEWNSHARWRSPQYRFKRHQLAGLDHRSRNHRPFYTLQALPNFLETLAVVEYDVEGVSLDLVDRLWGSAITRAWERWELAMRIIRRRLKEVHVYENLELFALRVAAYRAGTRPPLRESERRLRKLLYARRYRQALDELKSRILLNRGARDPKG